MYRYGRPGSIVHHRARTCYNASECAQHVADGRSRSRRFTHATVEAAGCHACHLGWRYFYFYFFGSADPRIFEDSNGSSADPDRSGFRWIRLPQVCTVTSVSVRIEKRANCAKNNKPKSGGLFLVNARPFPEHSSSRATFSAGRAWLEAWPKRACGVDPDRHDWATLTFTVIAEVRSCCTEMTKKS